MGFPYDVLITAASTLVAGVAGGIGGALLTGRQADRHDKQQRRLNAYTDLMLRLDELTRTFGAYETVADAKLNAKLVQRVNPAVGAIQVAYSAVYLSGSKNVQPLARDAWQAAWDIHAWFSPVDLSPETAPQTGDQLSALVTALQAASSKFADAARAELA